MNVYFLSLKYFNAKYFKYVLDLLKVTKVVRVLNDDTCIPKEFMNLLKDKTIIPLHKESFKNELTYFLANTFRADKEKYSRSIFFQIFKNLEVDDQNILVLAKPYTEISDRGYIQNTSYYVGPVCVSDEVPNYFNNIMAKQLGEEYTKKVCFCLFDEYLVRPTHVYVHKRCWNAWKNKRKKGAIYVIKNKLYHEFPDVFPLINRDGKQYLNSCFIDPKNIQDFKVIVEQAKEIEEEWEMRQSWDDDNWIEDYPNDPDMPGFDDPANW